MTRLTRNNTHASIQKKTKKSKNSFRTKDPLQDNLNRLLGVYAELVGLKDYRVAAKKLGLKSLSGSVTTKQMSGHIGMVKSAIREVKNGNN